MAITKLMHIKERKQGNPSAGLYACIGYILNEEKTENQIWVGGNCGTEVDEIYSAMMETKRVFSKMNGRQGYHFVLSFPKGQATENQAYETVKQFCESYLGNQYDYVFAIHNDREHLHGHICFNSVSRITGYKYRYEKGDWESIIQPIADKICEENGLERLKYGDQKIGKSYGEFLAEKEGRMTWEKIIKKDIDYAIAKSGTFVEFQKKMEELGYRLRFGLWKKQEPYMTFYAPGAKRGRRDRTLGKGYQYRDIVTRIQNPLKEKSISATPGVKNMKVNGRTIWRKRNRYQVRKIQNLFRARYYRYLNPYAIDLSKVQNQYLKIHQLSAEVGCILKYNLKSKNEAMELYQTIRGKMSEKERQALRRLVREEQQKKEMNQVKGVVIHGRGK